MADDGGRARQSDYRGARIGAAAALVVAVVFIIVVDAVSADYDASPVVLAALLGTIITLLGLEARSIVGGR